MRIGVITTSYPRWSGDPAGNFVAGHAHALRTLGFEVEVIAAGDARRTDDEPDVTRLPSALFYRGGAPDQLTHARASSLLAAAAFTARLTVATARRAHRFDALVAHWLAPSAIAALPSRMPLLAIAHGGDLHTLRRARLLAPMLELLKLRGAKLAFVSAELLAIARAAAPRLQRWLDTAAIVQPMGVELERFTAIAAARAHHAPAPTTPTLLIAARLVSLKGIDVAIDALARMRTPARLVIAGDGPEHAALAARARASAAAARIDLLGAVDTARRDALLRGARLVVIPSRVVAGGRTEGTPLIALEALASGLPIVASAVGGLRELAHHDAAHLVAPDDPAALAAALDRALQSPPPVAPNLVHLDWPNVAARLCTHAQVRIR